jgi:hypothetical protein
LARAEELVRTLASDRAKGETEWHGSTGKGRDHRHIGVANGEGMARGRGRLHGEPVRARPRNDSGRGAWVGAARDRGAGEPTSSSGNVGERERERLEKEQRVVHHSIYERTFDSLNQQPSEVSLIYI